MKSPNTPPRIVRWPLLLGRIAVSMLAALLLFAGPVAAESDSHDHKAEDDHGHEAGTAAESVHAEDDHERHAGSIEDDHSGHDDEASGAIRVSALGMEMAGIRLARAGKARLSRAVTLSGEIGFNEDRRVHVAPRYGGVIREMRLPLGAVVDTGDVLAVIESNSSLTSYKVCAPLSGRVVARDGAVGSYVSEGASLFVVADLSTVWVNLDVYPRHLSDVTTGARVTVRGVGLDQVAPGAVTYVAPVFDQERRVALARVVLSNPDGRWRPGMFVRAELQVATGAPVLAVERDAVQVLDGETVVFVPAGEGAFRTVPVTVGTTGATHAEIESGLALGDDYVAAGAFDLKAKIVTSSLGGHAGHGH